MQIIMLLWNMPGSYLIDWWTAVSLSPFRRYHSIRGVYKRIFFAFITPSNISVPFTGFLPVFSLQIFISSGMAQSGILWTTNSGSISLNLSQSSSGTSMSTCANPKTFAFKTSFENLQFAFDHTVSYSQPAFPWNRELLEQ